MSFLHEKKKNKNKNKAKIVESYRNFFWPLMDDWIFGKEFSNFN